MAEQKLDPSRQYGLVLEGGGAKGAYQIGVWKALREAGISISAVAGVSVGALNGALIAMEDFEKAEQIWSNIQYSQILDVDDETMENLLNMRLHELDYRMLTADSIKLLKEGGLDAAPLRHLIENCVDEEKLRTSPVKFYLTTFSLDRMREEVYETEDMPEGTIADYLMASACFPVFKNLPLHGGHYVDGGVVNLVPVDILIREGFTDLIVIRIHGLGVEKMVRIPSEVNVLEITPRVNLGKILDFNNQKSVRNMQIGYCDGRRLLENLGGTSYYIDSPEEEDFYASRFLQLPGAVKQALVREYGTDPEEENRIDRQLFERVLPRLAVELKLNLRGWTYRDLYLGLLELCAKTFQMEPFAIYSLSEFLTQIHGHWEEKGNEERGEVLPPRVELALRIALWEWENLIVQGQMEQ